MSAELRRRDQGRTALYRLYSYWGELLYVGISRYPYHRFRQHSGAWWWKHVAFDATTIEWYPTRRQALAEEWEAIALENPWANVARPVPWYDPDELPEDTPGIELREAIG